MRVRWFAPRLGTVVLVWAVCATVWGQTRTWLGTVNGNWSNGANWSGGVVPTSIETAVFNGAGNGNTTVSIGSIQFAPPSSSSKGMLFDTSAAVSYTIGGPNPGDGLITFSSVSIDGQGIITLSPSVRASELINAKLTVSSSTALAITNNSPAIGQTLTLAGGISATGGQNIAVSGRGTTVIAGPLNVSGGSGQLLNSAGQLVLRGSPMTVSSFQSTTDLLVNAPLSVNSFNLAGSLELNQPLTASSSFKGAGTVSGGAFGKIVSPDILANPNQTLTVQVVIGGGDVIFGDASSSATTGTVMPRGANTYSGVSDIRASSVNVTSIGDVGAAGNLGIGATIRLSDGATRATLLYTGPGESNNRGLQVQGGILDQSGAGLLRLTGAVSGAGVLTLQGSTLAAGEIAGSAADGASALNLDKGGTGTWTLSGTNTFTGRTSIGGGTLALDYDASDTSKLADAATLLLGSGTLALVGNSGTHTEVVGSTQVYGGASITRSGANVSTIHLNAITRNVGSFLEISGDGIATTTRLNLNGLLQGVFVNGQFAKNSTNIAGGTIVAVADSAYTNVNRLGGAIASNANALVRIVDGGSNGDINLAAPGTTSIYALMQGASGGTTTVNIGSGNTLKLASVGNVGTIFLPAGSSPLTLNGGTLTGGAELFVNDESASSAVKINSVISGGASLGKGGQGTLFLSGANSYSGQTAVTGGVVSVDLLANVGFVSGVGISSAAVVLDGGTLRYTGGGASTDRQLQVGTAIDGAVGTLDASGTGAVSFTFTGKILYGTGGERRTVQLAGTNTDNNTLAAAIIDNGIAQPPGPVSLVKTGPGRWALSGTNGYSGGTTISQGVLQLDGNGTLGANTASNLVNIAAGASLVFNRSGELYYNILNPIVGDGSVVVNNSIAFQGANTFSGGLTVNSGFLDVAAGSFGSGTIAMADNTRLTISGMSTTGLLDTTGTGALTYISSTLGATLTLSGAGTHAFAGTIAATVSLVKDGPGTQYLNGANTYTGPTNINGGILGGTGSISGAVFVNAGGAIAPGHSIGTFTLGSLDVSAGVFAVGSRALKFELDTPAASDKIVLTSGALVIGSGILEIDDFTFTAYPNFGPGAYTLIQGVSPIVGVLGSDLTETIGGFDATLAIGNSGRDLVLNVVPEPGGLALVVMALGAMIVGSRGRLIAPRAPRD